MEINKTVERVKESLNKIGMPLRGAKAKIAEDTGYHFSLIGKYIEGKRKISDRFIKIFCATYGVNEKWLRDGEGPMMMDAEMVSHLRTGDRPAITEDMLRGPMGKEIQRHHEDMQKKIDKLFIRYGADAYRFIELVLELENGQFIDIFWQLRKIIEHYSDERVNSLAHEKKVEKGWLLKERLIINSANVEQSDEEEQ